MLDVFASPEVLGIECVQSNTLDRTVLLAYVKGQSDVRMFVDLHLFVVGLFFVSVTSWVSDVWT